MALPTGEVTLNGAQFKFKDFNLNFPPFNGHDRTPHRHFWTLHPSFYIMARWAHILFHHTDALHRLKQSILSAICTWRTCIPNIRQDRKHARALNRYHTFTNIHTLTRLNMHSNIPQHTYTERSQCIIRQSTGEAPRQRTTQSVPRCTKCSGTYWFANTWSDSIYYQTCFKHSIKQHQTYKGEFTKTHSHTPHSDSCIQMWPSASSRMTPDGFTDSQTAIHRMLHSLQNEHASAGWQTQSAMTDWSNHTRVPKGCLGRGRLIPRGARLRCAIPVGSLGSRVKHSGVTSTLGFY